MARLRGHDAVGAASAQVRAGVREGRRVPAARPGAPARARAAGSRDARLPRRRAAPARAAASTPSCSSSSSATPSPTSSAPVARRARRRRACAGASRLDVRQLETGEQRGEIAGYLAKYATKSTEQAGGLLHRIAPDEVETAPVREHVRTFMRTAFELDTIAKQHDAARRAHAKRPAVNVETDWHPAALAIRLQDAMGTREPLRVRDARQHRAHRPRGAAAATAAERRDTHARGRARQRRARAPGRRRLDRPGRAPGRPAGAIGTIRGSRAARTRSATAGTA